MNEQKTHADSDSVRPVGEMEVTSLVGREVYTKNGVFVGEIEDVKIDFRNQTVSRLVLDYVNEDVLEVPRKKTGVLVPYRWVQSVGDIVLVADFIETMENDEE